MRLTVLGCSGSVVGPDSPASGYLIRTPGAKPVLVDMGGGVLGALQRETNPHDVTVMFSHLHADHCLDFPGLLVWRRYHPQPAIGRGLIFGPSDTAERLGHASAEAGGKIDDFSDTVDLDVWEDSHAVRVGGLEVTPFRVNHPPESYGLRLEDLSSGAVIAYSGDSARCDALLELARGADVFLCEASWEDPGEHPEGMHMSGLEAGEVAQEAGVKTLILTHIPPWSDAAAIAAEARSVFSGELLVAYPGMDLEVKPQQVAVYG